MPGSCLEIAWPHEFLGSNLGPGLLSAPLTPSDRWALALAGSEYQVLYIADDNEIRSLFPGHPHSAYEQTFQGDESVRIDAMDVHVKAGRVYWTNWHTGTISYRSLPPAAPPTTSNRHRRQIDRGVTHLNVSASLADPGGEQNSACKGRWELAERKARTQGSRDCLLNHSRHQDRLTFESVTSLSLLHVTIDQLVQLPGASLYQRMSNTDPRLT